MSGALPDFGQYLNLAGLAAGLLFDCPIKNDMASMIPLMLLSIISSARRARFSLRSPLKVLVTFKTPACRDERLIRSQNFSS
jgi:hypothetical protein